MSHEKVHWYDWMLTPKWMCILAALLFIVVLFVLGRYNIVDEGYIMNRFGEGLDDVSPENIIIHKPEVVNYYIGSKGTLRVGLIKEQGVKTVNRKEVRYQIVEIYDYESIIYLSILPPIDRPPVYVQTQDELIYEEK